MKDIKCVLNDRDKQGDVYPPRGAIKTTDFQFQYKYEFWANKHCLQYKCHGMSQTFAFILKNTRDMGFEIKLHHVLCKFFLSFNVLNCFKV